MTLKGLTTDPVPKRYPSGTRYGGKGCDAVPLSGYTPLGVPGGYLVACGAGFVVSGRPGTRRAEA